MIYSFSKFFTFKMWAFIPFLLGITLCIEPSVSFSGLTPDLEISDEDSLHSSPHSSPLLPSFSSEIQVITWIPPRKLYNNEVDIADMKLVVEGFLGNVYTLPQLTPQESFNKVWAILSGRIFSPYYQANLYEYTLLMVKMLLTEKPLGFSNPAASSSAATSVYFRPDVSCPTQPHDVHTALERLKSLPSLPILSKLCVAFRQIALAKMNILPKKSIFDTEFWDKNEFIGTTCLDALEMCHDAGSSLLERVRISAGRCLIVNELLTLLLEEARVLTTSPSTSSSQDIDHQLENYLRLARELIQKFPVPFGFTDFINRQQARRQHLEYVLQHHEMRTREASSSTSLLAEEAPWRHEPSHPEMIVPENQEPPQENQEFSGHSVTTSSSETFCFSHPITEESHAEQLPRREKSQRALRKPSEKRLHQTAFGTEEEATQDGANEMEAGPSKRKSSNREWVYSVYAPSKQQTPGFDYHIVTPSSYGWRKKRHPRTRFFPYLSKAPRQKRNQGNG